MGFDSLLISLGSLTIYISDSTNIAHSSIWMKRKPYRLVGRVPGRSAGTSPLGGYKAMRARTSSHRSPPSRQSEWGSFPQARPQLSLHMSTWRSSCLQPPTSAYIGIHGVSPSAKDICIEYVKGNKDRGRRSMQNIPGNYSVSDSQNGLSMNNWGILVNSTKSQFQVFHSFIFCIEWYS